MAELCRMYGVSRQTGYTWVARYRDANHDVRAVAERSRRPKSFPTALSQEVEDVIVAARKRWPKWGPRKLRQRLIEAYPGVAVPSASVMSKVLKRRGMTVPRRRRRRRAPVGVSAPFTGGDEPNAVWCMDFKGWFQTHDAVRCYPFTLIDAFSRYLLRCEGLADPDTKHVRSVLDSAFLAVGPPPSGHSFRWWSPVRLDRPSPVDRALRLAPQARPPRGDHRARQAPTKWPPRAPPPHAQGRDRVTARARPAAQQRRFDVWRREYNHERPHDALNLRRPASIYASSTRTYPHRYVQIPYDPFTTRIVRIDKLGFIRWRRRKILISSALKNEEIELDAQSDGTWNVKWGAIPLGWLDELRPERGLIVKRRTRGSNGVTSMALR